MSWSQSEQGPGSDARAPRRCGSGQRRYFGDPQAGANRAGSGAYQCAAGCRDAHPLDPDCVAFPCTDVSGHKRVWRRRAPCLLGLCVQVGNHQHRTNIEDCTAITPRARRWPCLCGSVEARGPPQPDLCAPVAGVIAAARSTVRRGCWGALGAPEPAYRADPGDVLGPWGLLRPRLCPCCATAAVSLGPLLCGGILGEDPPPALCAAITL